MSAAAIPGLSMAQPPDLAAAAARVRQLETLLAEASGGTSGTPTGGGFAAALAAAQAPAAAQSAAQAAAQSAARAPAAAGVVAPGTGGLAGIPGAPAGGIGTPAPGEPLEGGAGPVAGASPPMLEGTSTTGPSVGVGAPVQAPPSEAAAQLPATQAGGSPAQAYDSLIEQAAVRNGVPPAILHGLIEQESGFNPSARSSAGALGLTQLMPSTAAAMGVTEPLNPVQSIEGGARYLGTLMRQFGGNVTDALAAYNAGPGAVRTYGGVPPYRETEAYVARVLANAQAYGTAA